jgi:large conductance mechanosensitive channel
MSFRRDFQDFVFRGNVVDLAVGVMIGAAFGKIVGAMVDDVVMPLVSALLPGGEWRAWKIEPVPGMKFMIGHLLGVVIDFTITAAVLFMVLVKFIGRLRIKAPAAAPPATKVCAECLEAIPAAARRCKYCTSVAAAG